MPWTGSGAYRPSPGLRPLTDGVAVDVLPVLEGVLQHRAAHAGKRAAGDLLHELRALDIVPHVANQRARLAEVVVLRMQGRRRFYRVMSPSASQPSATKSVWSDQR